VITRKNFCHTNNLLTAKCDPCPRLVDMALAVNKGHFRRVKTIWSSLEIVKEIIYWGACDLYYTDRICRICLVTEIYGKVTRCHIPRVSDGFGACKVELLNMLVAGNTA
jgi:hypothetical protein